MRYTRKYEQSEKSIANFCDTSKKDKHKIIILRQALMNANKTIKELKKTYLDEMKNLMKE